MAPEKSDNLPMTFDVYGRRLAVDKEAGLWRVYVCGTEGKRRPADEIRIPPQLPPDDIGAYLADVCHEWASARHPDVRRLS